MKKHLVLLLFFVEALINLAYSRENINVDFEKEYQNWLALINMPEIYLSSISTLRTDNDEFRKIIQLGLPVVPLLINKIKQKSVNSQWLPFAVVSILKMKIDTIFNKNLNKFIYIDYPNFDNKENFILYWWDEGRKETSSIFNKYCAVYEAAVKENGKDVSKELLMKIKGLGIDALPYIVEKMKGGYEYLIPVFIDLTTVKDSEKNLKETSTKEECFKWWEENKEDWLLPPPESK